MGSHSRVCRRREKPRNDNSVKSQRAESRNLNARKQTTRPDKTSFFLDYSTNIRIKLDRIGLKRAPTTKTMNFNIELTFAQECELRQFRDTLPAVARDDLERICVDVMRQCFAYKNAFTSILKAPEVVPRDLQKYHETLSQQEPKDDFPLS